MLIRQLLLSQLSLASNMLYLVHLLVRRVQRHRCPRCRVTVVLLRLLAVVVAVVRQICDAEVAVAREQH